MADSPSIIATVDADFKDGEFYEVFCPEGSDEPWHVVVSVEENEKFTHWALMQMLQAKDWDVDFEWAVFMKTGRCGSSGLRHFSKKFTDGSAAFKTFSDWFEDKTGNRWLGDFTTTSQQFTAIAGKYLLLTPEQGKNVLEFKWEKERLRPKLGVSDVPVDIYFKDREQYQTYMTPDGDLWTAVMSIKEGERHSQYAILQVLVAKPEAKVEFDFVVFMRHGKLGGSAQRYAKRYTVEVAALSTFQQWFKEKTGNEWYGSFKDTLEEFSPQFGKFNLLGRAAWPEVVEFEERSKIQLIDSDVPVDAYYRDRDSYRVYHTENGDLWAAVVSCKDAHGYHKRFVLLQMLTKKLDASVDFDFVVLRRIGERGESGQWTAKKFTNELDALRTFKMWYQDETGNIWKGSFNKSLAEFEPVADKMVLLAQSEWEVATREVPLLDASQLALESFLAEGRRSRLLQSSNSMGASTTGPQKVSIDLLKRAMAAEEAKRPVESSNPDGDVEELPVPSDKDDRKTGSATPSADKDDRKTGSATPSAEKPKAPKQRDAPREDQASTPRPNAEAAAGDGPSPPPKSSSKKRAAAAVNDTLKTAVASDEDAYEVDPHFEHRDKYTNVLIQTKLLQKDASNKVKFFLMQLLAASEQAKVPEDETYCLYIRSWKSGTTGASNFKLLGSLETSKRSFGKNFFKKTKNEWRGDFDKTMAQFTAAPGEFVLVQGFD